MAVTGLVTSEAYLDHVTGEGHPESPDRVRAILRRLRADGLLDRNTGGRIVSTLEGGYALEGLASAVVDRVRTLVEE
jgi:acetoin utilization deacetylase AcuC-like enzyme